MQRPVSHGRVWLAGEAWHPRYSGYLQGALCSGTEVAERMAAALLFLKYRDLTVTQRALATPR